MVGADQFLLRIAPNGGCGDHEILHEMDDIAILATPSYFAGARRFCAPDIPIPRQIAHTRTRTASAARRREKRRCGVAARTQGVRGNHGRCEFHRQRRPVTSLAMLRTPHSKVLLEIVDRRLVVSIRLFFEKRFSMKFTL